MIHLDALTQVQEKLLEKHLEQKALSERPPSVIATGIKIKM